MPVDFLSDAQKNQYGRFSGPPSPTQLAGCFHLDDADRALVAKRRGDHNRLGFALQLCTVRFLGTFLADPTNVPENVVEYLSGQLGISGSECLPRYLDRSVTRHEHATEIRERHGYREFSSQPEHFRLVRWLYTRAWFSVERPSVLFDLATSWLVQRKVLLPGVTTLTRLIAQIRTRTFARLWASLSAAPNDVQRKRLERLLEVPDGERQSHLDRLRSGPTRVSGRALMSALDRLDEIRSLKSCEVDVAAVPPARIKALARYAASAWAPTIARMPDDRRIATLLAYAQSLETQALDDVLDLFDALVTEILAQAERIGRKERLRTLRDLDAAALTLREACSLLLDENLTSDELVAEIFSRVPREDLQRAVLQVGELARPSDERYHQELVGRYRRVRQFLPRFLNTIPFEASPAGQGVLRAVGFLKSIEGHTRPDMSGAPIDIVPKSWKRLALRSEGAIDRRAYTLCVLQRLQDALRRRDVFVVESERWSDPREKLLHGDRWNAARSHVCQSLGLQRTAKRELDELRRQLSAAYREVASRFSENEAVRIENSDGRDSLVLTGLDKLGETPSLVALRESVASLLPRVGLPEVLLEIQLRTGFAGEFTHVSENKARVSDLDVSVCAVLLAEACNIGLEPLVRRDVPALTRGRLTWVQQNYIRAETLAKANARLVDAQAAVPTAQAWGGGEVASADGLRFVTPLKTVNAGPNSKYFGRGRGITYYNFTSDQFTGFHGLVVPGTLRDSMFILEGLLEQQTSLRPTEVMADTAGASDVIFGLFWLLGYQFSPRLADIGGARFWRIDPTEEYGSLNGLAQHRANTDRIAASWDDMLRVAGSLKTGTVSASELIRSLLRSDRPSTLARAIGDLGRIAKTLYLLAYIDDEEYRRRILTQLNRHEARHSLARAIFHGRRGEVRQRYREGQEDQLSALGLVVNVVVLWNTVYMDAAVNELRTSGAPPLEEDVARLSPLEHRNINFLGQYSFALPKAVTEGALRPLRDPKEDYRHGELALA